MQRWILAALFVLAAAPAAWAEGSVTEPSAVPLFSAVVTDASAETLLGGPAEHGLYAAAELKLTRVARNDGVLLGWRAAWLVNHQVSIGGAGYMLGNRFPAPPDVQARSASRRYYSLGYGGLLLGYTVAPRRLVHAEATLLVGGGGAGDMHGGMRGGMRRGYAYDDRYDYARDDWQSARFLVAEPGLAAEVNVTPYVRLGLGIGYRMVGGVSGAGLSNRDLRGPAGSLTLKAGVM